ncbi:T9SS-dependent M36 family metallopeptidase [Aequorivita todarodis]|uniref:T9SS-dependent M36 family metallopeptidase n=1 Tax=Aequorivita todarodis TaxID=2036821 RepID=UPI00234FEABD|nr:T9SS-dependent M36 family metallopeptidase [Aequorivita todarodis]MDC8002058.1 T9SS-dependent M36 family metallopeptidase [Aequorivita todarodis]
MKKILYLFIIFTANLSFAQDYSGVIKTYLEQNRSAYSLQQQDISDISVVSQSFSTSMQAYTVYVEQRYQGIKLFNSTSPFLVKDGAVVSAKVSFTENIASKVNGVNPALTANIAIAKAAAALGLDAPSNLELLQQGMDNTYIFSDGNISLENIPVQLVYQKMENGNSLRLAWDLSIYLRDASHYYSVRMDATTGDLLETMDWVSQCHLPDFSATHKHGSKNNESILMGNHTSIKKNTLVDAQYRVFALPLRNPDDGPDTLVINPEDATASPFKWHDTNGAAGAEYTITRGNNVYAYLDLCDTDSGDSPDGGPTLNFDFPFNLPQAPANFRDASAVNLFYLNNTIHDVMYQYGFDEASGNFQENNYGNGGNGSDSVNAEGQDAGGNDNANFATPPDGGNPRMQMYLWGASSAPVANIFTINGGPLAGTYSGVAAGFGAGIPINLTQDLVLVEDDDAGPSSDPNDGCDNITNGPSINGKIAVIRRGECEFGFKVLAAQNNGAVAAIIVNNVAGNPPLMGGGVFGCQVTIPAFAISNVDGEPIITLLDGGGSVNGTINGTDVPVSRDGDLDTEVVVHEYGHGISNRLTGGPNNTGCLQNEEQMGEGWSDFFALVMTIYNGDQGADVRPMASYASGDPNGIRTHPYSTNFGVNPHTYDDIKTEVAPHGVGSVWAAMLWEMTWDLIDEYGFDPDIYNGNGGNNVALQLVIDGLKLQPCSPGFVDGRDAILEADVLANGGANRCIIWHAFARRGLGLSASQGSSSSKSDGTEAFDVPVDCQLGTNDNGSIKNFIIYPNPSKGEINIMSRVDVGNATLSIFDINGRKVFTQQVELHNSTSIQAGGLNAGVYLIKIESENSTQTSKLIIN